MSSGEGRPQAVCTPEDARSAFSVFHPSGIACLRGGAGTPEHPGAQEGGVGLEFYVAGEGPPVEAWGPLAGKMSVSRDLFFSALWFGGCRMLRCLRLAACLAPPLLLLKDRIVSLDKVDVSPQCFLPHDERAPEQQQQQQGEGEFAASGKLQWLAAVAGARRWEGLGAQGWRGPLPRRQEAPGASWTLTLLTAGEIYRGCAVKAVNPSQPASRVYAQVVGLPGDVLAIPWKHQQQQMQQADQSQQQQVVLQQLRQFSPDAKVLSREELLLLLQRLRASKEAFWRKGDGHRLQEQRRKQQQLLLQQQPLQDHRQQQQQRLVDTELARLLRSERKHKESQAVLTRHINELLRQQQQQRQEQQQQTEGYYLVLRVPSGQCWVESFGSPSCDSCRLESEGASTAAAAAARAAAAAGGATSLEGERPGGAAVSGPQGEQDVGQGAADACEEELAAAAAVEKDSFSFGLLPLSLVEGMIVAAAPAPDPARPRHQQHPQRPPRSSSNSSSSSLSGGEGRRWRETVVRLCIEVAALARLPASMKLTRLPELHERSARGTLILGS
ncbi:hypothetical protein Esti_003234 [Eimeria stiedai]